MLKQILSAINYCHLQGITHNDIKAENIMLVDSTDNLENPEVKLIDFGVARSSPQACPQLFGTILYMAPEMLKQNAQKEGKSDIWAIGILLYIMITGCTPY